MIHFDKLIRPSVGASAKRSEAERVSMFRAHRRFIGPWWMSDILINKVKSIIASFKNLATNGGLTRVNGLS